MPRTYNAVVADASCFILLDKIDGLPLLEKLFKTITTSPEVAKEFGKTLPEWVVIKTVQDKNFQSALFLQVDAGEASAIALYSSKISADTAKAIVAEDVQLEDVPQHPRPKHPRPHRRR